MSTIDKSQKTPDSLQEQKAFFNDRVKTVLKEKLMNRVNVAAVVASFAMMVDTLVYWSPGIVEVANSIDDNSSLELLIFFARVMEFPFAIFLIAVSGSCTDCGSTTVDNYHRTLKHFDKVGRLGPNFFKKQMDGDNDGCLVGYCQLQGMYIAAKERGFLEEFKDLKKATTKNIIPNF